MLLPHDQHFVDGNVLRLRQKKVYKRSHHYHEKGEEQEKPELQVAEHSQEGLSHNECRNHIHRNIYTLRS